MAVANRFTGFSGLYRTVRQLSTLELAPMGALTSKPYAFTARSWELRTTESVDVMDAYGSAIRVDTRGDEVMRITPRVNEDVNEEWINDRSRFAYDGLKRQRLDMPLLRNKDGALEPASWPEALSVAAEALLKTPVSHVAAVAGGMADAESMIALKDLMAKIGSDNLYGPAPSFMKGDVRGSYLFNSSIAGVEDADFVLLVGTDLRKESPLLNARLRKLVVHQGVSVCSVGPQVDLTYEYEHLGSTPKDLVAALDNPALTSQLVAAERPLVILGMGAVTAAIAGSTVAAMHKLNSMFDNLVTKDWAGVSLLQNDAAAVGALDIGFVPGVASEPMSEMKTVYLLAADNVASVPRDAFVIYQGHHGDEGAMMADVVLPGCAYTEKSGTFVNLEGRVQLTQRAVSAPGVAREDWSIVRALSEVMGKPLPYDTVEGVRGRLVEVSPTFAEYDQLEPTSMDIFNAQVAMRSAVGMPLLTDAPVTAMESPIENFYMTDPISRASSVMARCSAVFNP